MKVEWATIDAGHLRTGVRDMIPDIGKLLECLGGKVDLRNTDHNRLYGLTVLPTQDWINLIRHMCSLQSKRQG